MLICGPPTGVDLDYVRIALQKRSSGILVLSILGFGCMRGGSDIDQFHAVLYLTLRAHPEVRIENVTDNSYPSGCLRKLTWPAYDLYRSRVTNGRVSAYWCLTFIF